MILRRAARFVFGLLVCWAGGTFARSWYHGEPATWLVWLCAICFAFDTGAWHFEAAFKSLEGACTDNETTRTRD